jgi:hypothetical protein
VHAAEVRNRGNLPTLFYEEPFLLMPADAGGLLLADICVGGIF